MRHFSTAFLFSASSGDMHVKAAGDPGMAAVWLSGVTGLDAQFLQQAAEYAVLGGIGLLLILGVQWVLHLGWDFPELKKKH